MKIRFKLILIIFSSLIFISCVLLAYKIGACKRLNNFNNESISVETMFQKDNFIDYPLEQLPQNDSLFVLFVSSDCEFCHKALAYIYSDTFALTKSKIVVVFSNSISEIKSFFLTLKLTKKENIYVYSDRLSLVRTKISSITTPSLYSLHKRKISVLALGLKEFFEKVNLIK